MPSCRHFELSGEPTSQSKSTKGGGAHRERSLKLSQLQPVSTSLPLSPAPLPPPVGLKNDSSMLLLSTNHHHHRRQVPASVDACVVVGSLLPSTGQRIFSGRHSQRDPTTVSCRLDVSVQREVGLACADVWRMCSAIFFVLLVFFFVHLTAIEPPLPW